MPATRSQTGKHKFRNRRLPKGKNGGIELLLIQSVDNVGKQGEVVEVTEQGADSHIDALAKKYLGKDKYPFRQPGEVRVIYKIRPDHVAHGG